MSTLGRDELRRYSRHLLIPEIGLRGQERLRGARALVIGAGGLGSPVLQYLAAAGVGRLGIVDDDVVDASNLQRQTIFGVGDVGRLKAEVAAERLRALNPWIGLDVVPVRFEAGNARALVRLFDVVLDCADNFPTRYLINDACVLEDRPDVYASIYRFDAQLSTFHLDGGPCYRCLYPDPPEPQSVPTCAEGGVLGALAGIAGSWQANEAIKVLLGIGGRLRGRLLLLDALAARMREVSFARDRECAVCAEQPRIVDVTAAQPTAPATGMVEEIAAENLDAALAEGRQLLDVREPHERVLGTIDGAIVMPASELEVRMHELDSARRYVVACRVGVKSRWAIGRLRDAGFERVAHLAGGLLAYAGTHAEFEFF